MTAMDKVAFLGLGTMGAAMAANLARAGFAVTAWNRTAGRAPGLADLGVEIASSPAAAVADTPIVVICVSVTPDVEAVLFGEDGVASAARAETLIIDCSTIRHLGAGTSRPDCASVACGWWMRRSRVAVKGRRTRR